MVSLSLSHSIWPALVLSFIAGLSTVPAAPAADCQTATVGQPWSTCFDIYTNNNLTADQFATYNPGLNCSTLQLGQKVCISAGTLPSGTVGPSPNGTCYEYLVASGDTCSSIGLEFDITTTQIESFNTNTYKWMGCAKLQVGQVMCVSTGTPPPIPVNPDLECGPESPGNATCPLNACCSAFGFCGLTDEFCNTAGSNPCISNCLQPPVPSCNGFPENRRNMAYYGGFGDRRNCDTNIAASQIDWSRYTHGIFAFATISQYFQIQIDSQDIPLLQDMVGAKSTASGLKIMISVGGWDFSESEPTKDLFSLMISTSANRATFISSVEASLSQYGLDGVDIDFEYPAAIERGGPPEDKANLVSFFQELRAALPSTLISCATPAGYWFLKGFEVVNITQYVDWLNMLSYDYHGPWDTNITGQAPVTNPHTSILDMEDSVKLYVRAGVDMSKVNLGLAYYGRSYAVVDSSCEGYNCTMTGGGTPGLCTATPGILSQFEIDNLISMGNKPVFDEPSQTYYFDNTPSLTTFDQQDTWLVKTNFAGNTCFGGTVYWSLDQVIPGSDGTSGSPGGNDDVPTYIEITWNPNPYPSTGAASETFVQSAGTFVTTVTTTLPPSTQTFTETFVVQPWTQTVIGSTVVSGITEPVTETTVNPALTSVITTVEIIGSTVTSVATVTKTGTTVIVPVPTMTTTITVEGFPITLNSGGTPVNGPVPPFITQPDAVTPTWTWNILPPPSASTVTFTAPLTSSPTYSSTVPVPVISTQTATVTGPPGDHSRCDDSINIWSLLFGGIIGGCMPLDIGIQGGITPKAIQPPGWVGPWTDPFPLPTKPTLSGTSTTETTTSSTTSSTSSCTATPGPYRLPDDPENADYQDLGTDPTYRRRRSIVELPEHHDTPAARSAIPTERTTNVTQRAMQKRASEPRYIQAQGCGSAAKASSATFVSLSDVTGYVEYFTVGGETSGAISTNLYEVQVIGKPNEYTNQEHVFELGYIAQFYYDPPLNAQDCAWMVENIFGYTRADGTNMGQALVSTIDNVQNMVWVDKAMNQAKSNVVNRNRATAGNPPMKDQMDSIMNFDDAPEEARIYDLEYFLRNLAALGQYFQDTSSIFQDTAAKVQQLLSEITPSTPAEDDASLPLIFNQWLETLIDTYPAGCT
ncbi:hypothetical protein AX15_002419 [Amanita polypyramis BW_CC]|nr:hypothetical protein AX15_002419 [Amanita polypyramis BW_CC]